MAQVKANGIEIEYEEFGDKSKPTLLLVMGLGMQMVGWPQAFCEMIADKGFHVIRFDNRDTGLSTHFHDAGMPDMVAIGAALMAGEKPDTCYLLEDMGRDAAGLLDALNIEKAHVVGASMGGMIVQDLAINHSHRLLSMTSIMSTTGRRDLPQATPAAMEVLMSRPDGNDEDTLLAHAFRSQQTISGSKYPPIKEEVYARTRESMARNIDPAGIARQMAAIVASGDRVADLAKVNTPALIIHGTEDPLVPVSGGEDTAKCIPNAKLELIDGWGHTLPKELWQPIADMITGHALNA
jgi:pimeloyl-ACP methyl ester carboxylesterase